MCYYFEERPLIGSKLDHTFWLRRFSCFAVNIDVGRCLSVWDLMKHLFRRKSDLLTCKTSMFLCPWRQIRNQPLWYRAIFVFLWTLLIMHYAGFFKKCCQQIEPAINLKYFLFKDSTCSQFIQLCGTEALGHLLMMAETWSWNGIVSILHPALFGRLQLCMSGIYFGQGGGVKSAGNLTLKKTAALYPPTSAERGTEADATGSDNSLMKTNSKGISKQ